MVILALGILALVGIPTLLCVAGARFFGEAESEAAKRFP